MALSRTAVGSANTAQLTNSINLNSTFDCGTVTNGDLLIVGCAGTPNSTTRPVWVTPTKSSGTATIGTVSAIGEAGGSAANDESVRAWHLPVTGSGTLVITYGATIDSFGCDVMVLKYTGHDTGTPVTGGVTQNNTAGGQLSDSTLAATPATDDEVVCFVGFDTNNGGASAYDYTGTNFTERILPSDSSDFCMSTCATRAGSVSTSTTVNWPNENVSETVFTAAGVAFIVKVAGGTPNTPWMRAPRTTRPLWTPRGRGRTTRSR